MRKNFGPNPWLYPQPVLLIATYDEAGRPDVMNAAWGGPYSPDQVMLSLSEHQTTRNLRARGAFTVSFGDTRHAAACDYVGLVSAADTPDKLEKAGFHTSPKSTSSFNWANLGANSPNCSRPAVCFTIAVASMFHNTQNSISLGSVSS